MKKKIIVVSVCVACALVLVLGGTVFALSKYGNQSDLRAKYPLISEADYQIDDPGLSFEQRVAAAPNIAEIEIVEKLPDYTVTVKDDAYGTSKDVTFCQYKAKLVSNIANRSIATNSDNTFTITYAKEFAPSYPALDEGMTAICSIEAGSGAHEGKYIFYDRSFYYVDNQTALAAYEGDDSPAKTMCSKDTLIKKIKSLRSN